MILEDFDILDSTTCDVCIIGSGPVGSSLAIDLERRGLSVLVLESGRARPDPEIQSLSHAIVNSPHAHHRMDVAVSRSLGGTSQLWGGRCVPLDEIDFRQRDYVSDTGWPINFKDFHPHLGRAAELLGCNDGSFEAPDLRMPWDAEVEARYLERWVNETSTFRSLPGLKSSTKLNVLLNATVVDIALQPGGRAVKHICVMREGRKAIFGGATFYVLAQGGIETARFLLNIQAKQPRLFGGATTTLGRYYMGHMSGSIASIRFFDPIVAARIFLNIESAKSFARRRLTLKPEAQL